MYNAIHALRGEGTPPTSSRYAGGVVRTFREPPPDRGGEAGPPALNFRFRPADIGKIAPRSTPPRPRFRPPPPCDFGQSVGPKQAYDRLPRVPSVSVLRLAAGPCAIPFSPSQKTLLPPAARVHVYWPPAQTGDSLNPSAASVRKHAAAQTSLRPEQLHVHPERFRRPARQAGPL